MTTGFSIGGIASGLDTATMVQQLMQVERAPIVRLETRQAALRKVDGAWGEVVTKVSALRTALDSVRRADDWASFLSASSSDEAAVRATATGGGEPGTLGFAVTSLASTHQVATSGVYAAANALVGAGSLDILDATGNVSATIVTDGTSTLADLARMVDQAGAGVDAQVLKVGEGVYRLVVNATASGADARFQVDTTGLASLGTTSVLREGADATLDLGGGLVVSRPSNTITDLLDGVTLELRSTTTTEVVVGSAHDTTTAADAVAGLVTAATELLGVLARHTAYNPDTGVSGVLQGDPAARALQVELRDLLSRTAGTGTVDHASQVGIQLTRTGSVELDRTALTAALAADHDGVAAFFTDGLGASLHGFLEAVEGTGGSIARSREAIDGRIRAFDDQIDDFEVRMELREATLRRQFTGLETALAQLQSQGQWLAGQLGSLTSTS